MNEDEKAVKDLIKADLELYCKYNDVQLHDKQRSELVDLALKKEVPVEFLGNETYYAGLVGDSDAWKYLIKEYDRVSHH